MDRIKSILEYWDGGVIEAKDGSLYPEEPVINPNRLIKLPEVVITAEAPTYIKYKQAWEKENPFDIDKYVKYALMEHSSYTQDKDKNPISMGNNSKLAKAYLHQLNQDVPLRDSKRFFDVLEYSNYTDRAMLNIVPGSGDYDVKELQRALTDRGYKLPKSTKKYGTFDGVWGDETKNALLDWQNKNKPKSILDKATRLDRYSKNNY